MTMYRLFHFNPGERMASGHAELDLALDASLHGRVGPAIERGLYREVAQVETHNLASVFPLTNHIDSDWTLNSQIRARANPGHGCRSTSVGDIVLDETAGSLHACMQFGWERLDGAVRDVFLAHLGHAIAVLDPVAEAPEDRPEP